MFSTILKTANYYKEIFLCQMDEFNIFVIKL